MGSTLKNRCVGSQKKNLRSFFYGSEDIITFRDRILGKKSQAFQGLVTYLCQSYARGKGAATLADCCIQLPCPECGGLSFD